ncbi:expressed unknown protein [Ectocarpus siliculosus]|uniref:Uncharacterized protein n=1 Tax=Ectocarpus siliculosus TaxID=2880 RepID=D7G4N0_ECTSI|nr:expressed unknown protein [Ectocarpus siliculosus]|eukprot:CBJ33717.1 expressed unknown protein [Ectocarpus siliculosus]
MLPEFGDRDRIALWSTTVLPACLQRNGRNPLVVSLFDLHHTHRAMEGAMGSYYHGFAREHIVVIFFV